ncbi:MAG TPA: patatin-like phospholipase family protein [Ktedonobacterales bacterium]|jgi:NTE family protein
MAEMMSALAPMDPGDTERPGGNGFHPSAEPATRRGPRWYGYTGFVLSGGGARGALQVGALLALLEHGIQPDTVVGTSIGSWNGAWLANDPTRASVERLADAWRALHPAWVLLGREQRVSGPPQALSAALLLAAARRVASGRPALYGDTGLRLLVKRHLGGLEFERLALPLRVIATDLTHGTRAIFSTGDVADAVLASSSIPGIFPPVRLGDTVYVDGGVLDNCGVETALAIGARRLFVLDVGYDPTHAAHAHWATAAHPDEPPPRRPNGENTPNGLNAVLERSADVVNRYQLEAALRRIPAGIETHALRLTTPHGGGALDFGSADEWIAHAYHSTRDYLDAALPPPVRPRVPVGAGA